ncbi:MAG: hypothetical protein NC906_05185 [Candidatus Omnitrophica bacterium]|nr:hypothetical protein [Candidatus Omnitrophota bacterium]
MKRIILLAMLLTVLATAIYSHAQCKKTDAGKEIKTCCNCCVGCCSE